MTSAELTNSNGHDGETESASSGRTNLSPLHSTKKYLEMADTDPQLKRLLLPAEETLFEQLLRFGLYIGAVFQIVCLLAIVIYQAGPSDGIAALKDDPSDVECSENSPQVTPRRPHRPRKQEKKKRR
ncbi:Protein anon-73B1 [Melipona quadrifasciata]|uniref:Protein anon-73B1 n=1 Tax=Melipona quadrifasciata TaxID=166423 RepID=A0A0N1IT36_9HYME|nr:Protein anon-73B1 [Melipona quadrifasciata]